MLLFGAIEKIFTDYAVDKLVIEVGDLAWIQQRKAKNQIFIDAYYHSH